MSFFTNRRPLTIACIAATALLLASCSENEGSETAGAPAGAALTIEGLQALADQGEYQQVLSIIADRRRLGKETIGDLKLGLEISLQQLDGIAAEVFVERLIEKGEDDAGLMIPMARALFIQGRLGDAANLLTKPDLRPEDEIDALILQADISGLRGDNDKRVSLYQRVVEESPDDFRGHLGLAIHAIEQADFEAAATYAATAISLEPKDPIATYAVGATALYQGDYEKAAEFLTISTNLRPGNVAAYTELANLHLREGKIELAQKQLDIVYSLDADNQMGRYLSALILARRGNLDEAEKQLILTGPFTQTYLPAARAYGLVAYNLGKYAPASRHLQRFLNAVPTDRDVRMALVDSYIQIEKSAEALGLLQPVLALDPNDLDANLYSASAYAVAGKVRAAIPFYENALKLTEALPEPEPQQIKELRLKLAVSRFFAGDTTEAADQLAALPVEGITDFETLVLLANFHLRRFDSAAQSQVIAQMQQVNPGSVEASNFQGIMAYRSGDLDTAVTFYTAALEKNPEYLSALKNRGLALLAASKPAAAQLDLLDAAALNPEDGQVQAFLGRSYLELENFEMAAMHLQKAESALPEDPIILVDHSEALAGRGLLLLASKKAEAAKARAGNQQGLVDYIDTLLADWQKALKERETGSPAPEKESETEDKAAATERG